jgi:hypothetical protein
LSLVDKRAIQCSHGRLPGPLCIPDISEGCRVAVI